MGLRNGSIRETNTLWLREKMTKQISLVGSNIKNVSVQNGVVKTITIVGDGVDGSGTTYPVENLVIEWDDLPQQVQNTADTFLKHLSREFNKQVANEDSDTW
jgi:hypothetical protein